MLVPILVTVGAWFYHRKSDRVIKFTILYSCLLITGLFLLASIHGAIIKYQLDSNQIMEVHSPAAFPFAVQRFLIYHDSYDRDFYHRIVLGWPDGIPIYTHEIHTEQQGEVDRFQRLVCAQVLGSIYLIFTIPIILGIEFYMDYQKLKELEGRFCL